jgi:4-diphosphocytidyl-2C-methyl-D-erythritol kinase
LVEIRTDVNRMAHYGDEIAQGIGSIVVKLLPVGINNFIAADCAISFSTQPVFL